MKKFFTLKHILVMVGAVLALVAFFVAFGAGLKRDGVELTGILIGKPTIITNGSKADATKPWDVCAGFSLVGLLLMLAGAIVCSLVGLLGKTTHKKLFIWMAIVMILGSLFVFLLQLGVLIAVAAKYPKYVEDVGRTLDTLKLNACTVISGIAGILSAGAMIASICVKEK